MDPENVLPELNKEHLSRIVGEVIARDICSVDVELGIYKKP